ALHNTVKLQPGVALPLRAFTLAYIPASQQIVAHFRRPGGVADAALDAVAFVHNPDGSLAYSFDLRPFGFARIASVNYRSTSDELILVVVDTAGTTRLLVTDRAGKPRRSYRIDAVPYLTDIAPISSPPFNGDIGVVEGQPSFFGRIFLP